MNANLDTAIRLAAFRWLGEATAIHGDVLPRSLLQQGFDFQDERIPLVSPQGIFKPRLMDLPLSITTTSGGPQRRLRPQRPADLPLPRHRPQPPG